MPNDNYLKVNNEFFFFDTKDEASRAAAWRLASKRANGSLERIAVWHSRDKGRYPGEKGIDPHPVVGDQLAPFSPAVRVVGYAFHKDRKESAATAAEAATE
jgi:hypothetical protein